MTRGGPEHQALHPFARIPIVEVDGITLTETLAITGYLDEAVPEPPLLPVDMRARARTRTWMSQCSDYLLRDVARMILGRRGSAAARASG